MEVTKLLTSTTEQPSHHDESTFFEGEYQQFSTDEKFAWWVKEFAAGSRIWSIHPLEQFHQEFYQHLCKYSPEEEVDTLIKALSLFWYIPTDVSGCLLQWSHENEAWQKKVTHLKNETTKDNFIRNFYSHCSEGERVEYWRLKFVYYTVGFSYHPYELIHKDLKRELIRFEKNSYPIILQSLVSIFELDTTKCNVLIEIEEDDPENEKLLEEWVYSQEDNLER